MGTHREKGAYTFWSYAVGLPLPSSAILSWKFSHVLHKILRDGHRNVSMLSFKFCWNYLFKYTFIHLFLSTDACDPEFSFLSQFIALAWSNTHTIVKVHFVRSMYVNTICYVLREHQQLGENQMCNSKLDPCINS